MKLERKTEEYTLTIPREDILAIAEGLDQGSRMRLQNADEAHAKHYEGVSAAIERSKSEQYGKLRKELMDACGIEGSWHT